MKSKLLPVIAEPGYAKLPKIFKAKWLAALRSGEYKQATGILVEETKTQEDRDVKNLSYCCLGVACHIQGISNKAMGTLTQPDSLSTKKLNKIPKALWESSLYLGEMSPIERLIGLNDAEHWSFKRIARWIEKNL